MKYLTIIFLIACTQIKDTPIPISSPHTSFSSALSIPTKEYSHSVDIMVAFLWPSEITSDSHREDLMDVINTSRILKKKKEIFQSKKAQIILRYKQFECTCALEIRCEEGETEENLDLCLEIEDELSVHNQNLIEIYGFVDHIKNLVKRMGGDWLETQIDFPELPLSTFDFDNLNLTLSSLGIDSQGLPLAYEFKKPLIQNQPNFQRLTFSAPRLLEGGQWQIDVSALSTSSSLLFQGDLYWINKGKKRRGIIFWEHVKKDSL